MGIEPQELEPRVSARCMLFCSHAWGCACAMHGEVCKENDIACAMCRCGVLCGHACAHAWMLESCCRDRHGGVL